MKPPWLDFVAAGRQSLVFGTETWVVKIPRWSWQSMLGRMLVHPKTPARALSSLGGLVEPFVLLDNIGFSSVAVARNQPVPGSTRRWAVRWAVASARLRAEDFLDRRLASATPAEAAALVGAMLDTLDEMRARGWHVIDFIMSNFAVDADGTVKLVDAGLLIPAAHLLGPSQQVSSRWFIHRMVPDYLEVLAAIAGRHPARAGGQSELAEVMGHFPRRIAAWRAGRGLGSTPKEGPRPAAPSSAVRAAIFAALKPGRRNLLLTQRPSSGYTPPHHAIPSEN